MTLEELIDQWEIDSAIDDNHLDRESVRTPNIHAKYLRILMGYKMKLSALKSEYNTMRQRKFRYYRGEIGREELQGYGWPQWQGVKPLKNEMNEFLEGDADLNKITIKCQYLENMIQAVESIMTQVKARDWQIRNTVEWKKFIAGQ
jgi:hypothetical protein